jgi:hypothetical protein
LYEVQKDLQDILKDRYFLMLERRIFPQKFDVRVIRSTLTPAGGIRDNKRSGNLFEIPLKNLNQK